MRCDDVQARIGPLREGVLADDLRAALQKHAAGCAACRAQLERRERLENLVRASLRIPDPGEAYFERLRSRVLSAPEAGRAPRRRAALPILVAAALSAAAAVMFVLGPSLSWIPRPAVAPRLAETPGVPRPFPAPAGIPRPAGSATGTAPLEHPEAPARAKPEPAAPPPAAAPKGPEGILAVRPEPPAGTADRAARMTDEAVEVALAETPVERVSALCAAAEAQLRELPEAIAKDPALAAELAGAYRLLVQEGVTGVLREKGESEGDLAVARDVAALRARDHEATLAALAGGTSGALREHLSLALEASRSLAGR